MNLQILCQIVIGSPTPIPPPLRVVFQGCSMSMYKGAKTSGRKKKKVAARTSENSNRPHQICCQSATLFPLTTSKRSFITPILDLENKHDLERTLFKKWFWSHIHPPIIYKPILLTSEIPQISSILKGWQLYLFSPHSDSILGSETYWIYPLTYLLFYSLAVGCWKIANYAG